MRRQAMGFWSLKLAGAENRPTAVCSLSKRLGHELSRVGPDGYLFLGVYGGSFMLIPLKSNIYSNSRSNFAYRGTPCF